MSPSDLSGVDIIDPSGALEALATIVSFLESKGGLGVSPGHHGRVRALSLAIARRLELSAEDLRRLAIAASYHDLGMVALPESILSHPRRLTAEEYELVKQHPAHGVAILSPVARDGGVLEAILHHHENFGGGGYPAGLAGEEIPLLARVLAVPEVFDSMIDVRPWRSALSLATARALVRENGGSLFDPRVIEAFMAIDEPELVRCLDGQG